MINRKVIDISHFNTVQNISMVKNAGIVGIIHKATEGTGYVDGNYAHWHAPVTQAGLLWGAYHFMHPGSVKAQVDHFLNVAGVDDAMLYAFDWETSSTGDASEADAEQFMRLLEARTGRKGVVYSGNVAKEKIRGRNQYLGSCRLWLAQYSTIPKCQASWNTWWLWQYSDGEVGLGPHGCPGVSGHVDTNSWAGTDEALRVEWSGKAKVS